jgi:hypothetical protein
MNCARLHRRLSGTAVLLLACAFSFPLQAQDVNIALGKPVSASGPVWSGQVPEHLTDGDYNDQTHPLASSGTLGFYYEVDLEEEYQLSRIILFNRIGCCPERLSNYRVSLFADGNGSLGERLWSADIRTDGSHSPDGGQDVLTSNLDPGGTFSGRFIRITNLSNQAYNPQIAELEVYQAPLPQIVLFTVDHGDITQTGNPALPGAATLSWQVDRFDSLEIDPGIGAVSGPSGSLTVSPPATTTYTLTAANGSGKSTAAVTVGVDETAVHPIITEFMADNSSVLEDEDGDGSDWFEVYNPNAFYLNIQGYYVTDDPRVPSQWRFPSVSIPGHGFLIVFASGKNRAVPGRELHTSFELKKAGEYLALVAPDGMTVLQQFPEDYPLTPTYPPQKENLSYGIGSDGKSGFFNPPTPGAPNGLGLAGFVKDTSFSTDRGFYDAPIQVALASATAGAQIRYTLDGSEPAEGHGTLYTQPVSISKTTVLRAAAFKSGLVPAGADTQTYIFLDDVIASSVMNKTITQNAAYAPQMRGALTDLPALSLVAAAAINDTSEVKASVEWILPDGSHGFHENAGVRYYGGAFTSFAKKSFRLYFRSVYGTPKLKYPLFAGHDHGIPAAEAFDQLELRSGSHDMVERGFYMSNIFTDDTMLDMGNLNPHGRFVHLYLKGTYWGMYHLRERWNGSMLAEYLGGKKEDFEAINGNWNVGGWAEPGSPYDGDGSAWARIKSLRSDYEGVKPYLDVPHYADYMLMYMFGESEDEYRCVGPSGPGSGFKFFLNDADGFTRAAGNHTAMGRPGRLNGDGPGSIFSMLLGEGHPDYKVLLADRIYKHFFNVGAMTPARNKARLLERCNQVQRAFIAESARWGYRTPASWESAKQDYIKNVLPGRTAAVISQYRAAGFYAPIEAPVFSQEGGEVAPGFLLSVSAPAGTIYATADGGDPRLPGGDIAPAARLLSPGLTRVNLVGQDSPVSALVPASGALGTTWTEPDFDDAGWLSSARGAGVGYDDLPDYLPYIDLSVLSVMKDINASVYIRYEFEVADPSQVTGLELRLRYDDGYVAYLNGQPIASSNAPDPVSWDSAAVQSHPDTAAVLFETATLSRPASWQLLRTGKNVLAIHGLNQNAAGSDMLIEAELNGIVAQKAQGVRIDRTTLVRARATTASQWSALNEAVFALDSSGLRITEIMYHPPDPPPGSLFGAEDLEFIELQNTGSLPLNLTGISITAGVAFTFPDGDGTPENDLRPGEIVLIVKDLEAFRSVYDDAGLYIAGEYRGQLQNSGDRLVLQDRLKKVLLDFTYSDEWYAETDGGGYSLVIADSSLDPSAWNDGGSWVPSGFFRGSPGRVESVSTQGGRQAPGDANQDGALDLGDAIALLFKLFGGDAVLPCGGETLRSGGNLKLLDADGDGAVSITDVIYTLHYLYLSGPPHILGTRCVPIEGCASTCRP